MRKILSVATIGGGTGHYALLRALMNIPDIAITAIVAVTDNGGSSGELRDEYGTLPPGDILKALLAMSEMDPEAARTILLERFDKGRYKGHTVGNLLLVKSAEKRDFMHAIHAMRMLLCVEHEVYPVTLNPRVHINARLTNGNRITGEHAIDVYRGDDPIAHVEVTPSNAALYPPTYQTLRNADVIIVAPGSLHTSLLPVLKLYGVIGVLAESAATKLVVCNTMTRKGDTHGMCPHQFVGVLEDVARIQFDLALCDDSTLQPEILTRYAKEEAFPMRLSCTCVPDDRFIAEKLVTSNELVRHDFTLLGRVLTRMLF